MGIWTRLGAHALFVLLLMWSAVSHESVAIAGSPGEGCPPLTPINLLANPGVDDGRFPSTALPESWSTLAWDEESASFTWDDAVSHSGSKSARIDNGTPNDAAWVQTIDVAPFTDYVLSGWIKTEGVAHNEDLVDAGANLSLYGGFTVSAGVFGTQDWTFVTLPFNSGPDSEVTIAARVGFFAGTTTGTAWFDDLEVVAADSGLAEDSNLVENGGFEAGLFVVNGSPPGWTPELRRGHAVGLAWDDTLAFDGDKSLRIELPAKGAAAWTQTVMVRPHTAYRASAWIQTMHVVGAKKGGGAHLSIDEVGAISTTLRGTRGWTFVELTFSSGNRDEVTLSAALGTMVQEARGAARFDAMRIAPVAPVPNPRWRTLGLIYTSSDFSFVDAAGASHRVVTQMTPAEVDRAAAALRRFYGADVPALTGGEMYPSLTIRFPPTLTSLSEFGGAFWPSPDDTASDLDPAFDAVFVLWDPTGTDLATGLPFSLASFAGLTPPRGTDQTYTTAIIEAVSSKQRNVLKHEWGHSILFYHDALGVAPKPAVDNHIDDTDNRYVHCGTGQSYILEDETDDAPILWSIYNNTRGFTRDYYSGTTARPSTPNTCLGITPAAWHAGGPVSKLPPGPGN